MNYFCMDNKIKILIGGPIHYIKEYSLLSWSNAINNLQFCSNQLDKVMVDTSEKTWNVPSMTGFSYKKILIDQTPSKGLIHRRLVAASNMLIDIVLENTFSHLFMVECDVILPSYAIIKLLVADKPIIEGLYYPGFHPNGYWTAGDIVEDCSPRGTMGCCLIKREVLEEIRFRYEPALLAACPDAFFHHDAFQRGFRSYVHCGVICRHLHNARGTRGWERLDARMK